MEANVTRSGNLQLILQSHNTVMEYYNTVKLLQT